VSVIDTSAAVSIGEDRDEFPWQTIIESIEDGGLTPFLGAGVSNPPLPSARELADEMAKATEYPFKSRDLMEVAQYSATLTDPSKPKRFVRKHFERIPDPNFRDRTQAHAILASLPIPIYLTTNYDTYMEKALAAHRRPAKSQICRWNSGLKLRYKDTTNDHEATAGSPVVYHLHGSVEDHDTFVLTEDDYLDFIVNARRFDGESDPAQRVIPPSVDELIALNSLMFVGYGLKDWNLRVLLRTLVQSADKSAQKLSVSVQLEPDDGVVEAVGKPAAIKYLNKYFEGLRIVVYWGKLDTFLSELGNRWKAWEESGGGSDG
jgi:SIR2-like protein